MLCGEPSAAGVGSVACSPRAPNAMNAMKMPVQ